MPYIGLSLSSYLCFFLPICFRNICFGDNRDCILLCFLSLSRLFVLHLIRKECDILITVIYQLIGFVSPEICLPCCALVLWGLEHHSCDDGALTDAVACQEAARTFTLRHNVRTNVAFAQRHPGETTQNDNDSDILSGRKC